MASCCFVVVVTKYDRLARSLKDLLEIVDLIQSRGAGFRSLGEDIDTTKSGGSSMIKTRTHARKPRPLCRFL